MSKLIRDTKDGIYSLMLTPFNEDRSIDYATYEKYVEWQASQGVGHLFAICGSSEMKNLSLEERMKIVEENPGIFSHGSFKQVTKMFSEMKIGINPKTYGMDPITRKRVQVDYTFRVFALLQAIRDNDSSKVTLTFE